MKLYISFKTKRFYIIFKSNIDFFFIPLNIDALPCHIHLPISLWIKDPHSRAPKKNTSHENEVLPKDTTHLIQRPCYQRGSPCQDWMGPHEDLLSIIQRRKRKWYGHVSCWSGLAKTITQGTVKGGRNKGRQKKVGRQHQGMVRPEVGQVSDGSGEQRKMEETGCEIICDASTTLAVKG